MKIYVNSAGFSLFSTSKCDICQLEVHDVKVYPQYCQLILDRWVGSERNLVA